MPIISSKDRRVMIERSHEDIVAKEFFSNANSVAAYLSIALGFASLQFENPEPFALISLFISMGWLSTVRDAYLKISKTYMPQRSGVIRFLWVLYQVRIFVFGFIFLSLISIGVITEEVIYKAYGYSDT